MTIDLSDGLPYLLLWVALGMAMFQGGRWGWPIFTGLSLVAAIVAGIVEWAGLVVIALFTGGVPRGRAADALHRRAHTGMERSCDLCHRSSRPSSAVDP